MDELWLVLYWTGPIGVGFFLVCLGLMIFLLAKADAVSKQTKAMTRQEMPLPKHDQVV